MGAGRISAKTGALIGIGLLAISAWSLPANARAYSTGLAAHQSRNAIGGDDTDLFMVFFEKNKAISRQGSVVVTPTGAQDYAIIAYDERTREVGRVYGEGGRSARLMLDLPVGKTRMFYVRVVVKGSRNDSVPGSGFKRASLDPGVVTKVLPPYEIAVEDNDPAANTSPDIPGQAAAPQFPWQQPVAASASHVRSELEIAVPAYGALAPVLLGRDETGKIVPAQTYFVATQTMGKRNRGTYNVSFGWRADKKGAPTLNEWWVDSEWGEIQYSWVPPQNGDPHFYRSTGSSNKAFVVGTDGSVSGVGRLRNEDGFTVRLMVYQQEGNGLSLRMYKGTQATAASLIEEYHLVPSNRPVYVAARDAVVERQAAEKAAKKSGGGGLLGTLAQLGGAAAGMALTDGSTAGALAGASIFARNDSEREAMLQGANQALADQQAQVQAQQADDARFQAGLKDAIARGQAQRDATLAAQAKAQAEARARAGQSIVRSGTVARANPVTVVAQPVRSPAPTLNTPTVQVRAPISRTTPVAAPRAPVTVTGGQSTTENIIEGTWRSVDEVGGVSIYARYRHELSDQVISELRLVNMNDYPVYVSVTPKYVCKDGSSHSAFARSVSVAVNGTASGDSAGLSDYACNKAQPGAIGFSSISVTAK